MGNTTFYNLKTTLNQSYRQKEPIFKYFIVIIPYLKMKNGRLLESLHILINRN